VQLGDDSASRTYDVAFEEVAADPNFIANDTTPPTIPTGVTATTPSGVEADVSWTASTDNVGVTGYDIFRNGALLTSVGTVTSYADTTVAPLNSYWYQVRAKDAAGNTSDLSNSANVETPPLFSDGLESGNFSKWTSNSGLVAEEVLTFIAHKVQKNIRELEGALTRVLAFSAIHQHQVDEDTAARLLEDIIPAGARRPLTIETIQEAVADYYQLSVEDMKGKRRDKHIVFPRQVAMYIVREETPSSLPVIGQAFGGRDHTTALHSIDKIANELKEDERLRYEIQAIRERLYADR